MRASSFQRSSDDPAKGYPVMNSALGRLIPKPVDLMAEYGCECWLDEYEIFQTCVFEDSAGSTATLKFGLLEKTITLIISTGTVEAFKLRDGYIVGSYFPQGENYFNLRLEKAGIDTAVTIVVWPIFQIEIAGLSHSPMSLFPRDF